MRHPTPLALLAGMLLVSHLTHVRAYHRLPPGSGAWPRTGQPAMRGVTVGPIESSQQPERGYGTAASAALLDELVRMGVQWISVTPFGRVWSLHSPEILMDFEAPYAANRQAIARFVQQAHRRGIRVMLIPHLWVETGGWRGEIDFESEEAWQRYREAYRDFLLRWASDAGSWGVEALSIGVECTSWSGRFGAYWTSLIAEVRSVFPGLLTYSANWDEVDGVLFWDQLDFIGVNAFYPLANHPDASYETYVAGAEAALIGVETLADVLDMPVVFAEVGYTTRKDAAVQPWLWPDHMTDVVLDEHEQARALSALLAAALPRPWFAGFFVWRYYAHLDDVSQEAPWGFSPHAKLAERLLAEIFALPWGADPPDLPWTVPHQPPEWLQTHEPPRINLLPRSPMYW